MTVLYKLAKGQLSRQHHYDFGLRALKAVLVMAGELKRGSPDLNEVNEMQSCVFSNNFNLYYSEIIMVTVYISQPATSLLWSLPLTLYHLRKTAKRSRNHVLKYNA